MLNVKTLLSKMVPLLNYTKTEGVWAAPTDISFSTGTSVRNLTNFTLPDAGKYLIIIFAAFTSTSASGKKYVNVSATSGSSTTLTSNSYIDAPPVSVGGRTTISFSFIYDSTANKRLYVNGFQNSGGTDTVAVRVQALRLR